MRIIISAIAILLILNSCSKKVYNISPKAKAFIPYIEGQQLQFISDNNEQEKIIIEKIDSFISPSDPLDLNPKKLEYFKVYSKLRKEEDFLTDFISINSNEQGETLVNINFWTGKSKFYNTEPYTLKELESYETQIINIGEVELNDVIVFESKEIKFKERENFVDKLYWSKSKGVIRFEKHNMIWNLLIN